MTKPQIAVRITLDFLENQPWQLEIAAIQAKPRKGAMTFKFKQK